MVAFMRQQGVTLALIGAFVACTAMMVVTLLVAATVDEGGLQLQHDCRRRRLRAR
jgi:hypothetical protein